MAPCGGANALWLFRSRAKDNQSDSKWQSEYYSQKPFDSNILGKGKSGNHAVSETGSQRWQKAYVREAIGVKT